MLHTHILNDDLILRITLWRRKNKYRNFHFIVKKTGSERLHNFPNVTHVKVIELVSNPSLSHKLLLFENIHKHCNMLTLLKWGQDGFNKDNDGECKGRKREKRFQQSQKYEANETCMGIRDSKKSLFPVQITQYGCELRSAHEDRELSLGFIVWNDSKTFIQEEAGSFSPTCVKIT